MQIIITAEQALFIAQILKDSVDSLAWDIPTLVRDAYIEKVVDTIKRLGLSYEEL